MSTTDPTRTPIDDDDLTSDEETMSEDVNEQSMSENSDNDYEDDDAAESMSENSDYDDGGEDIESIPEDSDYDVDEEDKESLPEDSALNSDGEPAEDSDSEDAQSGEVPDSGYLEGDSDSDSDNAEKPVDSSDSESEAKLSAAEDSVDDVPVSNPPEERPKVQKFPVEKPDDPEVEAAAMKKGKIYHRKESEITDFRAGAELIQLFKAKAKPPKKRSGEGEGNDNLAARRQRLKALEEEKEKEEEMRNEIAKLNEKEVYNSLVKLHFEEERKKKREEKIWSRFDQPDWFDFPVDPEGWTEKDNREIWCDRPGYASKPGFDPNWTHLKDFKEMSKACKKGGLPPVGPFYVPYRKHNPVVSVIMEETLKPKEIIEELDMNEEFMQWSSCVFYDGSSYEGTVWDDVAQGKGVYISAQGLVRYEGEWFRSQMEGHGVTEVQIPDYQPLPGSQDEKEMRANGKIITRDFMSRDDRKWLEMDIKDSVDVSSGLFQVPFYENDEWTRQFGSKPETGRYRYAGQWKHGRMHGCGVYEVNERTIYGRFYFGEYTGSTVGCDSNISALHAGIAEVAAAKARMFMNKPDGMVREDVGPYNDPQHPYLYEEDDVWMAPGFVNQFYEVPDYWKAYVDDVDEEREMWLNSFYKAPLRLPMPSELEHWWSKDEVQEFMLVKSEPQPDPEDPTQLIEPDPLILHTPTGRLIDYVDDEEHGLRLYWLPEDGEEGEEEEEEGGGYEEGEVNKERVKFLPLGFDEFHGRVEEIVEDVKEDEKEPNPFWVFIVYACKRAEKWIKKKKKDSDKRTVLVEKKLELVDVEATLRETIEDMDEELVRLQKEELKKLEMGLQEEEDVIPSEETSQLDEKFIPVQGGIEEIKGEGEEKEMEKVKGEGEKKEMEKVKGEGEESKAENKEEEEEEEEDEEEDDEDKPTSFGSIIDDQDSTKSDQNEKKSGRSPFASLSLPFASLVLVPSQLQLSFSKWKDSKLPPKICPPPPPSPSSSSSSSSLIHSCLVSQEPQMSLSSVSFPRSIDQGLTLRAGRQAQHQGKHITRARMRSHTRHKGSAERHRKIAGRKPGVSWSWAATDQSEKLNILSLHTPV